MHWSFKAASQLIERHPDRDVFVCASGISPSGHVHIGNFREIVTTFFVAKALEYLGKQVRFIFSWDDYDRFRKVPSGLPEHYSEYIGLPYSEVPDPHGCHESYAAHFESQFEETLEAFDIHPEYIYQSQMYQSGAYVEGVREALIKRREIYDVLMRYKTQSWNEVARDRYYPVTVYCRECGRDHILNLSYDELSDTIEYHCSCGHHEIAELEGFNRIKLNWKIDWPMRWRYEEVIFEPGGRDHSSENGSYTVSSDIMRTVFDGNAPHYIPYEFIGLKGNHAKMSSSTGHLITPDELLKIYPREMILYLFAKYQNTDAFDIGLDDDVIRLYTEFERNLRKFKEGLEIDEELNQVLQLSGAATSNLDKDPKFALIASTLPLVNFNISVLYRLFSRERPLEPDPFKLKCEKATHWINHWHRERLIQVNDTFNSQYYATLEREERRWLKAFLTLSETYVGDNDGFMTEVYEIVQGKTPAERKKSQKRFFEIIYQMILNQKNGPNIAVLVEVVGIKILKNLLTPKRYVFENIKEQRVS